jgi:tRNA modification GTPase
MLLASAVTEIEGTTRDVLREHLSLKGIPLKVNDTAGLRESENPIEQEGIRRAWDVIGKADVVLYLVDSSKGLSLEDREIIAKLAVDNLQLVFSKSDLVHEPPKCDLPALSVSTLSGYGMEALIERITGQTSDYNQDNQAFMARRRHVDALSRARDCIDQARVSFSTTQSGELMAEDLRAAQQFLNEITGEYSSDDLLGKIFSSFCIGK